MSLETTFESIAESLKAIVTHMTTVQAATAVLGAPETTTERKTRAKKADAAPNEAPQPTAAATTEPAATPAPTTPAVSTVSSKPWADVLAKIVEVNKSELPSAGRKGVENILAKFFGADVVGKKVPSLEAIGRNDEVFAFAASLLVPPAVAEADDLGL